MWQGIIYLLNMFKLIEVFVQKLPYMCCFIADMSTQFFGCPLTASLSNRPGHFIFHFQLHPVRIDLRWRGETTQLNRMSWHGNGSFPAVADSSFLQNHSCQLPMVRWEIFRVTKSKFSPKKSHVKNISSIKRVMEMTRESTDTPQN